MSSSKGQFFLLGAILLIVLFFLGMPFITPALTTPTDDLSLLSENVEREFGHALTLGANESDITNKLMDFANFLNKTFLHRNADFRAVWVASNGNQLFYGNFFESTQQLNISTTAGTVSMGTAHNSTSSTVLALSSPYNINISFQDQFASHDWVLEKHHLWVFYELERDGALVREHFTR